MSYSSLENPKIAAFTREQALYGLEKLTDETAGASSRYSALIPLTDGATITAYNTIDGGSFTAEEFYVGCYLPGHWRDVTVVGSVLAIKANPSITDVNEPA